MHYIGIGQLIPFLLLLFSGSADASFRDGLLTSVVRCNLRCYRGCSKAPPNPPFLHPFRHLGGGDEQQQNKLWWCPPSLLAQGQLWQFGKTAFLSCCAPLPSPPSFCGLPSRCHERNGRGSRYPPSLLLLLFLLRQKVGIKVPFPQTPPCRGSLGSLPLVPLYLFSIVRSSTSSFSQRGRRREDVTSFRHHVPAPLLVPTVLPPPRQQLGSPSQMGRGRGGGTDGRKFNLTRYCRRHPFWEGERGEGRG